MAGPVDIQEDLVLRAAEHCRALRQALVARPTATQRSRSGGLKKQQRHLQDSEQRLLMREQQELFEEQKRELNEQKADLLEKDEQLRRQRQQLDESRLYGDRCEQLAELRAKELAVAKAQLLELQERLESSVDSFSEQQRSYESCLRSWSAERLRVQSLQAELAAFDSRHSRELQELKECLLPLRPSGGRCCLVAQPPVQQTQSVLWGSVPLRPTLEDMWVQTSRDVVDKDLHTETVQELRSQQLQSQLEATREQEALLEKLQGLENVQEKLEHAEWKLETPELGGQRQLCGFEEYVMHGELQQARASLRDRESEVRMEKDRGEAISRAAEQRVELLRTQTQALMEQTRIQASQAAFEYSQEQKRTENLHEELAESAAQIRGAQEELLASRTELQLASTEADLEQRNLRFALGEQLLECEQHCTRLTCDRQQQESVAAWLQDSWRRCELAPALDQVKTLRKAMDDDQLHVEALQMQNHELALEAAEQRAAMSFGTTEVAFARAEVATWKRESQELTAKLEKQDSFALARRAVGAGGGGGDGRGIICKEAGDCRGRGWETLAACRGDFELGQRAQRASIRSGLAPLQPNSGATGGAAKCPGAAREAGDAVVRASRNHFGGRGNPASPAASDGPGRHSPSWACCCTRGDATLPAETSRRPGGSARTTTTRYRPGQGVVPTWPMPSRTLRYAG
eukprot:s183_g1.t1